MAKFIFNVKNISELRGAVSKMELKGIKLTTKLPAAQGRPPLRKLAAELNGRKDVTVQWSEYFPQSLLEGKEVVLTPPELVLYVVSAKTMNARTGKPNSSPSKCRITLAEVREFIGSSTRGKPSQAKVVAAACVKMTKAGKAGWSPTQIEVISVEREVIDTPVKTSESKPKASKDAAEGKNTGKPAKPVSETVKPPTSKPGKRKSTIPDEVQVVGATLHTDDTPEVTPQSLDELVHPADVVPV